jgi:hypothetical protein
MLEKVPRVVGLVLHRLEVRLLLRVVVGDMGTTEALVETERCEKLREGVTLHRCAAVGVDGQARLDTATRHRFGKQLRCQVLALLRCDHPTNDVSAEEVEDDVRMQEDALLQCRQLGDVPGPNLVRGGRAECWLRIGVRQALISPLFRFSKLGEHAVDGANRCQYMPG